MSTTAKTTSRSSKSAKAPKPDLSTQGIKKVMKAKASREDSTETKKPLTLDEIKGLAPKATEAKEKAAPKSTGIENGGMTIVNEAVGLHFSIAKAVLDGGKQVPAEADLVLAVVGENEIPLIVRTAQSKVNGDLFIQAFLVEKGSGHHLILDAAKGQMVKVFWA